MFTDLYKEYANLIILLSSSSRIVSSISKSAFSSVRLIRGKLLHEKYPPPHFPFIIIIKIWTVKWETKYLQMVFTKFNKYLGIRET